MGVGSTQCSPMPVLDANRARRSGGPLEIWPSSSVSQRQKLRRLTLGDSRFLEDIKHEATA
jgi:hypothetical protein